MIRPSLPLRRRVRHAAFTLIELLTVIAIILVLAGLLLHIAGSANTKASTARASSEIKAMETALESYKADNGAYPRPVTAGNDSDSLNAQTDTDPGGTAVAKYQAANQFLYQALSGTPVTGTTYGKRYMEFKPGQLMDGTGSGLTSTTTPGPKTLVVDPFGLVYGYSTAMAYQAEKAQAAGTTAPTTFGYNPTFDLWSTSGYGAGGKSYPSGITGTGCGALWMKNW